MKLTIAFLSVLTLGAAMAEAQPVVNSCGVLNVASYAIPGLPNSSISQGSVFAIFGAGLGPQTGVKVSTFPLQTSFQGVSVSVTSGPQR